MTSLRDIVAKDSVGNATCPSSEEEFLALNGYADLADAVKCLPSVYRRVFLQRYAQGKDSEAIAASEGVSVRTVESRLYRARRMLKEVLARG